MSREFHYVIVYDTHTHTWSIDIDNEERAFPQGTIYDDSAEEWHNEADLVHTNPKWYYDSHRLNVRLLEKLKEVNIHEDKN